ncbi:MAG TPA: class I SAM-dependent methyltransferase, partial [Halothiobacillus sp.]|nr:class I SAM-dependent methyltransferase [Halothiobacillus sp.]
SDRLTAVKMINDELIASFSKVGIDHGGVVASFGPGKGFCVQILKNEEIFNETASLEFTTESGWTGRATLEALCRDRLRIPLHPPSVMMNKFLRMTNRPGVRILDIGGHNRSKNDLSALFGDSECIVLDILPGENVDVVGDAHEMSKLFAPESFDAVYSVSTFEHLSMPWAVAVQMNKILKPGGLGLIFSHQTLAMHDQPWDFWRFSDTAWDALFNEKTGFEILERAMDFEQYVLPHIWRPGKAHEEYAVGFEGSVALIRKTGPCSLAWDVTPHDLTQTNYPANR